jgi:hypothetical protein
VNNEVYTFVDDQDHPQMIEIHAELQRLSGLLHDAGYMPCMKVDLYDVEEEKVFHLCHHSEKLAIAFGVINTPPLQIRKNLWVCEDCHTSTKFISKLVGRAIMVSDAGCFYHFENVCIFTLFLVPVTAPSFLFRTKPITIFCMSMLQNAGQVHPRNLYILLALQGFEEMNSAKHND